MKTNLTSKKERQDIIKLFRKHHKLKFSEIEKTLGVRSNLLNYHLRKLIEEKLLEKKDDEYKLTLEAEHILPSFSQVIGKEKGPLSIITAAVINNNKICLLRRERRPYKGYWGLIGGKIMVHESIEDTAVREVQEETGLRCSFDNVCGVLHERVIENEVYKHALVIFFCKLNTKDTSLNHTEEGQLKWFYLDELPKNIIPSDEYMIKELLNQDFCFKEVIMKDNEGELTDMKIS